MSVSLHEGSEFTKLIGANAEIAKLRTALEKIRDSRQQGRLMFVEPVGDYIMRVKEIARVALQPL